MSWPNYNQVREDHVRRANIEAANQPKDMIAEVANCLAYEETPDEIHTKLIKAGLSEEMAYLTFVAGKLLAKDRDKLTDEMLHAREKVR